MERGTTLFLKITVILIGIPIVALCGYGLPLFTIGAADFFPAYWLYPTIAIMYASAVPYFVALVQAFRLLTYIDKNHAFSERSVRAIKNIKLCAIAIAVLYGAASPLLYALAEFDDAPGILAIGLVIMFASIVVAAFAAVLQKLLHNAIELKSENDLTV